VAAFRCSAQAIFSFKCGIIGGADRFLDEAEIITIIKGVTSTSEEL
jgi:hypothetical protein